MLVQLNWGQTPIKRPPSNQRCLNQLHPISAAQGNELVVEVVVGVMQGAGAFAVADFSVHAVAVADEAVHAGFGLQHVRKVFGAHGGLLNHHIVFAHDAVHHLFGKLRFIRMVDGGWVIALKLESASRPKSSACVVGNFAHALLDHVEHFGGEGAHGALHFAMVGHDIGGFAGVNHGDRDDACIDRFFVAADDGLKGLHHLAGHGHGVDTVVGQSRMATFAMDGDFEFVARRHDGARAERELTHFKAGPVVHAVDGLHGKLFKQTILNHFTCTATALFCRLENEIHGAVEIFIF